MPGAIASKGPPPGAPVAPVMPDQVSRDLLRFAQDPPADALARMGSRAQGLSATLDTNGDGRLDLAVPSADRTELRVMTIAGGGLKELKTIDLGAPVTGNITRAGGTRLSVPVKGGKRHVDAAAP